MTSFEIVLCFFCTQTIFSALQAFCCFFFVDFLLHIDWQSSLLLIILLNLAIGTCGMSIGNKLAHVCQNKTKKKLYLSTWINSFFLILYFSGLVIGSFAKSSKKVFCITLIVYFINITISGKYCTFVLINY